MSENTDFDTGRDYLQRLSERFTAEQIAKLSELMLRSQSLHAKLDEVYNEAEELLNEQDIEDPMDDKWSFDAIFNQYIEADGEHWPDVILMN